jgi:CRP/FNR family transcriptional regulator, cyclic AMP receptor protein
MATSVVEKVQQHFSRYPRRVYPKGQILIFADESPEYVFYIVKGRVREYDVSYRGDEAMVNLFKPLAFFPMSWAINRTPNKYFYKTEIETELHVVPIDAALDFLKANPDVMLDLLSRVYRGMDGLLGRIVHLMSGTAKSRLIYELLIECHRSGERADDGTYKLPGLNESDLAARAGLSRETVNRELRKIRQYVKVTPKNLVINDIAALEKALGTEI